MKLKFIASSKNIHVAPHQVWHSGANEYQVIIQGVGVVKTFTNLSQAADFAMSKVRELEFNYASAECEA